MQFGPHFWQANSFISGYRIDYLSLYIYFSDILAIITILLELIFYKKRQINYFWINLSIGIFIYNLIQLFWVKQQWVHIVWSIRIMLCLMASVSIYYNLKNIKKYIFWIALGQLSIIAIIALTQFIHQGSLNGFWYYLGERLFSIQTPGIAKTDLFGRLILRPYAFFSHPNTMAGYALLMGYVAYIFSKSPYYKIKIIGLFLTTFILVGISFSQIAWVALSLFLLISSINRKHPIKLNKIHLVILSLLVVISPKILQALPFLRSDIVSRNLILQNIKITPSTLLLGQGWFGSLLSRTSYINIVDIQPIHNVIWELVISIGFIPCLFALYLFYKNVYKKINEINEGLLAPIALIVLPISFDHYILTQIQILYAFGMFVVALTAFLYNKN